MVDVSQLLGDEGERPYVERQIKRMFCLTAMNVLKRALTITT